MSPPAIGLLYRLQQAGGFLPRPALAESMAGLNKKDRHGLNRMGVKMGFHTVFSTAMLKPAIRTGVVGLWRVWKESCPPVPQGGAVSVAIEGPADFYATIGFAVLGSRAVRVDMFERLSALLRKETRKGSAPLPTHATSWVGTSVEGLVGICRTLGYEVSGKDALQVWRPRQRRKQR